MKYIVVEKRKAKDAGLSLIGHLTKDGRIIINEKEVDNLRINGSINEKIAYLEGEVYSTIEMKKEIKQGGWKHDTNL